MSFTARTYREFWPQYIRAHSRLSTQRAHLASTLVGILCAAAALGSGQLIWLLLSPLVAFAIAVLSHFLFEGNQPTMLRRPLWSVRADMHMCGLLMAGRMRKEVARLAATKPGASLP